MHHYMAVVSMSMSLCWVEMYANRIGGMLLFCFGRLSKNVLCNYVTPSPLSFAHY